MIDAWCLEHPEYADAMDEFIDELVRNPNHPKHSRLRVLTLQGNEVPGFAQYHYFPPGIPIPLVLLIEEEDGAGGRLAQNMITVLAPLSPYEVIPPHEMV